MRKRTVSAVIALVCVIPFLLMALESVQSEGNWGLTQYILLLQNNRFFHAFWNSVLYTAAILAVNLPLSLLAAYGFSRFVFRGREVLFWIYIVIHTPVYHYKNLIASYTHLYWGETGFMRLFEPVPDRKSVV